MPRWTGTDLSAADEHWPSHGVQSIGESNEKSNSALKLKSM